MYITQIKVNNYRNYESQELELSNGLNIFYGDNAQGKTNLLEAIYVCSHGKSYRTIKDDELIMFGKEYMNITCMLEKNERTEKIQIIINDEKSKEIYINDIKAKKMSELLGKIQVITFKPEDMELVKDSAAIRRKFLDTEISKLDEYYMHNLQKYNKVLLQKNNYLKQGYNISMEELDIWNMQLIKYGKEIINLRRKYLNDINEYIKSIHKDITYNNENINIKYVNNVDIDNYEEELKNVYNEEIRLKTTQVGPHKDDFIFEINEMDARKYGSQGQQRTCVLSLKFSQIEYIKETTHEMPILLLDDVLSELDEKRKERMIEYINNMQTILTCTDLKNEVYNKLNIEKKHCINNGKIAEKM